MMLSLTLFFCFPELSPICFFGQVGKGKVAATDKLLLTLGVNGDLAQPGFKIPATAQRRRVRQGSRQQLLLLLLILLARSLLVHPLQRDWQVSKALTAGCKKSRSYQSVRSLPISRASVQTAAAGKESSRSHHFYHLLIHTLWLRGRGKQEARV